MLMLQISGALYSQTISNPVRTVRAGSEIGYPPYSIVTEEGEADGFSVELLHAALHAMHYEVTFKVDEWTVVKNDLEIGEVEVLPLVGRTPEREEIFDFTVPYLTMHGAIVTHKDNTQIYSQSDLAGKTIAVLAGDNAEEFVRRTMPDTTIVTTQTFLDSLLLVSEKQVDAVIIQQLVALQLINEYQLDSIKIAGPPIQEFSQSFCFAVQEGNKDLLAILNEGLALVLADGTYERLYAKWFTPIISLSRISERIVIGGDKDYPPYEFLDENGEPTGFNVELTLAVAEELGITVDIVLDTWSNTYQRLINNEINMIQGVFYSLERDQTFSFSQPYLEVPHVIITRKGELSDVTAMDELAGYRIIVMEQDIMHQRAIEFGYDSQLILVSSQEEALRLLSSGEGDCVLAAEIPALYWIKENKWKNLDIRARIAVPEYNYAVLEGSAEESVLRQLSQALVTLKAKGTYHSIYSKWFGVYEKTPSTFFNFLRTFSFIFVGVLVVVLLIILWSVMLRRQVRLKTRLLKIQSEELSVRMKEKDEAEGRIRASEKRFRDYIEHSPIGVFICNETGDYLEVNNAASIQTGYTQTELLKMNIRDMVPPDKVTSARQSFQQLNEKGSFTHTQLYQRKDGSKGYWSISAVKLSDTRFLGFTTDITELKQAEAAILSERERLAVTLRSIGDGVITTDIEGNVTLINKVAENLTGWSLKEAVGKSLSEVFHIIHENTGLPVRSPLERVIETGMVVELENHTLLLAKDGERRIIADSGAPIFDSSSSMIGMVLVFRDMTDEYRIQEQLQQTAKLDSLGVLAGGIAHDFNNLLSGIFGYAQLAKESADNGEECGKYVDEILHVFNRAKDLTQQLLTFSQGGKPVLKTQEIGNLIKDSTSFALSGSNIRSSFTIPETLWLCDIDENQIGQVVDNIVLNAQQAMPLGGTIHITAENAYIRKDQILPLVEGEYVHIAITDTGIGIKENLLPKIFDPFFTTKQKGNGLGLATSYSIMRKHDGAITVNSNHNEGSIFHLYIPRSSNHTIQEHSGKTVKHTGTGIILILDDEKILRNIVGEMLRRMGYTPIEAADGIEVMEIIQKQLENFDQSGDPAQQLKAAVFDLTIPGGMGGKETVQKVRELLPDLPIFAASGYSNDAIISEPEDYGFTGSLVKPFKMEDLAQLLAEHLQ